MNIICFLSVRPSPRFYAMCKALHAAGPYPVYLCIDDSSYKIPDYDGAVPLIQIDAAEAEAAGYKGSVLYFKDRACSRDKALYYFSYGNVPPFKHVWFLEEDVFLPSYKTLPAIDSKWVDHDLLSSSHTVIQERRTDWHWPHVFSQTDLGPPYAFSMICAVRVSKKLLTAIRTYAASQKGLFMDEALFNTLALQSGLRVGCPYELSTIEYRADWKDWQIELRNLYHPIKEVDEHERLRRVLAREERGLLENLLHPFD